MKIYAEKMEKELNEKSQKGDQRKSKALKREKNPHRKSLEPPFRWNASHHVMDIINYIGADKAKILNVDQGVRHAVSLSIEEWKFR